MNELNLEWGKKNSFILILNIKYKLCSILEALV